MIGEMLKESLAAEVNDFLEKVKIEETPATD